DQGIAVVQAAHLSHGGLGPVVRVGHIKVPDLFALGIDIDNAVAAVIGDHRVAVGEALGGFAAHNGGAADFPDDLFVRGNFLHFARGGIGGDDEEIAVLKELNV